MFNKFKAMFVSPTVKSVFKQQGFLRQVACISMFCLCCWRCHCYSIAPCGWQQTGDDERYLMPQPITVPLLTAPSRTLWCITPNTVQIHDKTWWDQPHPPSKVKTCQWMQHEKILLPKQKTKNRNAVVFCLFICVFSVCCITVICLTIFNFRFKWTRYLFLFWWSVLIRCVRIADYRVVLFCCDFAYQIDYPVVPDK